MKLHSNSKRISNHHHVCLHRPLQRRWQKQQQCTSHEVAQHLYTFCKRTRILELQHCDLPGQVMVQITTEVVHMPELCIKEGWKAAAWAFMKNDSCPLGPEEWLLQLPRIAAERLQCSILSTTTGCKQPRWSVRHQSSADTTSPHARRRLWITANT